jgi:hypothetical protein
MTTSDDVPGEAPEFDALTIPTPLQRRTFDLLGVPLTM